MMQSGKILLTLAERRDRRHGFREFLLQKFSADLSKHEVELHVQEKAGQKASIVCVHVFSFLS